MLHFSKTTIKRRYGIIIVLQTQHGLNASFSINKLFADRGRMTRTLYSFDTEYRQEKLPPVIQWVNINSLPHTGIRINNQQDNLSDPDRIFGQILIIRKGRIQNPVKYEPGYFNHDVRHLLVVKANTQVFIIKGTVSREKSSVFVKLALLGVTTKDQQRLVLHLKILPPERKYFFIVSGQAAESDL